MTEEWASVVGYEGIYEVSNLGNVKRLDRTVMLNDGTLRFYKGKSLSQSLSAGYPRVSILTKSKKVHRLVAESFIENDNNLDQVNHIDGNKLNNHFTNLEWCDCMYNIKHSYDNNLKDPTKGISHGMSKLSEKDVLEIRKLHKSSNLKNYEIADMFQTNTSNITKITKRVTWKHV